MKYKKGTFVIVPNLDELKGKPSEMQSIYLWICQHSDSDGLCFPKKATIGREAGCSHNTVDKYLKQLVDDGFLDIKQRRNKDGKNTSNEYQLLILGRGDVNNGIPSQPNIGSQTISNINYTNITIDKQQVAYKIIGDKTLPLDRGDTPLKRINSIYNTLFYYEYGINDNQSVGLKMKIFKSLLVDYTELQLAYLLIVYFTWKGMDGNNTRDREFLVSNTHAITLFKGQLNKYVAWAKNVSGYDKEFENSDDLLVIIGKYILSLTK